MKPQLILYVPAFLLLPVASVFGQDKSQTKDFDFFAKGMNSYRLTETGYYGRMKTIINGQSPGHSNSTNIDVNWNHWFGGVGAGLTLSGTWSGNHYTYDQLYRDWTISPNLSYGKTLTDRWGIYARADVTFGQNKNIDKSPPATNTTKDDLFGYGARVAFPYRFSKYTALTTELNYDFLQTKEDNGKIKESGFGIGIHLEDYLRCNQMKCDPGSGFKLSKDKYDPGSVFISAETVAEFSFGDRKFSSNLSPITFKNNFNSADIELNGAIYLIDYVGIGGGIDFGHMMEKSTGNKYSWNYFNFDPEVYINTPVDNGWRNFFVKGGGYFGTNTNKTTSGSTTFTDKFSVTGFNAGAGYNAFFAEETALQTCIYYRSVTNKDKDSGNKNTQRGIAVSVGLTHFF